MRARRFKRLLLVLALLLAVLALFLSGGVVLVHGTPDYYKPSSLTREQIDAASQSAEQTLTRMQNLAAESHAAEIRTGSAKSAATTRPSDENTFTFSEDELNGLFQKWAELHGWRESLDRLVTDPVIILQPNRVILAGHSRLKRLDTILGLHFEPHVDDQGRFDLNLVSVMAGKLPLPSETVISSVRERAFQSLRFRVGYWQQRARIEPSGLANQSAMYASLGKLLIREFDRAPDQAVLFIPSGGPGFVPVKLTQLNVADRSITFTVEPFDASQRGDLLNHIRQPLPSQPD